MKSKRLIIVPQGGLANRMRAIASAVVCSRRLNVPLTVVWHRNKELNSPFNQLFITDDVPFTVIEPSRIKYDFYYQFPRKRNLYLSGLANKVRGNLIMNIDRGVEQDELIRLIDNHKGDVIINSGLQFADFTHDTISSIFKFSNKVASAKKQLLNTLKPQYALHIRRTDNVESIKNSPIDLFEEIIEKEILKNPAVLFYLATDDANTKNYLHGKYPANLIVNARDAARDTEAGMIDAAAEFCIMAECDIIYGSYWSSFSEISALYGNKELIVVKR